MSDKKWKCKVSFFHLSQKCNATTLEAKAIFVIYCLRPPLHLLTQTTDVWHNPTVSDTEREGDESEWELGKTADRKTKECDSLLPFGWGICTKSKFPLCSSDTYDTSSGSLQLISIKPMAAQPNYSHPASSDRSQDLAIINGEVMHMHTCLCSDMQTDMHMYTNKQINVCINSLLFFTSVLLWAMWFYNKEQFCLFHMNNFCFCVFVILN